MEHEPCRFLSDAKGASQFARGDAVLGVGDAPDSDEPRGQGQRTVLENRAYLRGKLLATALRPALEHSPSGDVADVIAPALRADDPAIRPFQFEHVFMADDRIGEVANGIDQGFRKNGVWYGSVLFRFRGERIRGIVIPLNHPIESEFAFQLHRWDVQSVVDDLPCQDG